MNITTNTNTEKTPLVFKNITVQRADLIAENKDSVLVQFATTLHI